MTGAQVQEYGKLIFCKRIFTPVADVLNDPVECHLLYAQALHHNVQVGKALPILLLPQETKIVLLYTYSI